MPLEVRVHQSDGQISSEGLCPTTFCRLLPACLSLFAHSVATIEGDARSLASAGVLKELGCDRGSLTPDESTFTPRPQTKWPRSLKRWNRRSATSTIWSGVRRQDLLGLFNTRRIWEGLDK